MTKLNPKRNIDRTEESSQDAISDHSGDMRSGFYYITKVARFEAKILWRSWMFRVFSILMLSILF
jgi:hypothetical protein